jgi:hypothetical protein
MFEEEGTRQPHEASALAPPVGTQGNIMISDLIPEELLLEPPIARHHHDADQRHLTPLEFAIGIELLRRAHAARMHKRGKPERTPITFSRYALLRGAELSPNPGNLARVAGVIGRLQLPVGDMPPLILAAQEPTRGRWRVTISRHWLQRPFAGVPLPLPRTPAVLALLLFLHGVTADGSASRQLRFESFCNKLRIGDRKWTRSRRRAALTTALKIVNRHLRYIGSNRVFELVNLDRDHLQVRAHDYCDSRDRPTPTVVHRRVPRRRRPIARVPTKPLEHAL